jgi:hypothetical protein
MRYPTQSAEVIGEPDWAVVEAVAKVPARQRAAVFLRYREDLPSWRSPISWIFGSAQREHEPGDDAHDDNRRRDRGHCVHEHWPSYSPLEFCHTLAPD